MTITVTAEDQATSKTYEIQVHRAPSTNDVLRDLIPSAGQTLVPAYANNTRSYTVAVGNHIASVQIQPVTDHVMATVTVNGVSVVSGQYSDSISIAEGSPCTVFAYRTSFQL